MDTRLPKGWERGDREFYVSITGLRPNGFFGFLLFIRYAVPSKIQAETADGALYVGVQKINGVQHTLTAWESEAHMRKYIYSGAHKTAIKVFRRIASGKTFGYVSKTLPSWDQVHGLWKGCGRGG